MPVTFVPLDDRPCCLHFPIRVAALAGVELRVPPADWLGRFHEPGQVERILAWLSDQPDPWLVSLDMLTFGGLVASRRPELSLERALERFEQFARQAAGRRVLAFQSILRTAPTQSSAAEVEQAEWLVELGCVSVRARSGEAQAARRAAELEGLLSAAVVAGYQALRERNFHLNQVALEWAARTGQSLLLGIDDSKTLGWNVLEARQLEESIQASGACAWVAPGTDESAMLLLTRLLQPQPIQPVWWGSPQVVGRYEDRSLEAVLEAQARAAGVQLSSRAPRQLFLWAPSDEQREAVQASSEPLRSDFVPALEAALERGPVALADLRYANGADPVLAQALLESGLAARLTAFSAWNTAGNALGTALSALALADGAHDGERRAFLLERFADDYLYQSRVRAQLRAGLGHPGFSLSVREQELVAPELATRMQAGLEMLARQLGSRDHDWRVSLPWGRLFEVAVEAFPRGETGSPTG